MYKNAVMNGSLVSQVRIDDVYEIVTGYRANGRRHGDETRVVCPRWDHLENDPSCDLNLADGIWHCHACGHGGGIITLIVESAYLSRQLTGNLRLRAAYQLLEQITGHTVALHELKDQPIPASGSARKVIEVHSRQAYPYRDIHGKTRYEVVRIDGLNAEGKKDKDLYGRVPLPAGGWSQRPDGTWVMHDTFGRRVCIDGTPIELPELTYDGEQRKRLPSKYLMTLKYSIRVPYRLPELLKALAEGETTLFVTEGEKKCDAFVARTGLCATTWFGGANEDPEPEWERYFYRFKRVVILADDDDAGRAAAARRAAYFLACGVEAVTVVTFAQDGEGYDVEDWLTARLELTKDHVIEEITSLLAARPWRTQ